MTGTSLRLLFVIRSLATEAGGAERVLSQICSELVDRGHSVEIASFDGPRTCDFYPLDPRVRRRRLGIGDVHAHTGLIELVRKIRALRRLIRQTKPDLAIGFMHSAFVPLAIGGWGTGVRVIASEHISYEHYHKRPLQKLLVLATARLCAVITIPLERVRLGFPALIRENMITVPNPVAMCSADRTTSNSPPRILFVANFRAQKDHRVLVDAFAKLAPLYPDWEMRLVGSGELLEATRQQVLSLGLESRVCIPGATNDVATEYASADLFAVSSFYESFGLGTAEALASGIPVIGFSDCAGTNELVIDGQNGVLVSGPDRASALAEGLAKLMSDEGLRRRLGSNGPDSVAHYSVDATTDRWEELVRNVYSRGQPRRMMVREHG